MLGVVLHSTLGRSSGLQVMAAATQRTSLPAIRDAENAFTPKKALRSLARDALNAFADAQHDGPTCLDELFPWKAYLASHARGEMVVGEGIIRAVVDQIKDVKDPNRGRRPRTDFIFYRVDGSAYRAHPGTKPKNDSAPVYCPPSHTTELGYNLTSGTRGQWKFSRTRMHVEFHKPTSWASSKHS